MINPTLIISTSLVGLLIFTYLMNKKVEEIVICNDAIDVSIIEPDIELFTTPNSSPMVSPTLSIEYDIIEP